MTPMRPTTSPIAGWAWGKEHRVGWAVLALVVVSVGVACWMARPIVRTWTVGAALAESSPDADEHVQSALSRFKDGLENARAQFRGRSLFFVPEPPAPPPPVVDHRPATPSAPPPPSSYGGPAILYVVNGAVYLNDGTRLTADEPEHGGVRLVSLDAPWSARLEWRGREFDVEIFQRNEVVVPDAPAKPAPSDASPASSPSDSSTPESF